MACCSGQDWRCPICRQGVGALPLPSSANAATTDDDDARSASDDGVGDDDGEAAARDGGGAPPPRSPPPRCDDKDRHQGQWRCAVCSRANDRCGWRCGRWAKERARGSRGAHELRLSRPATGAGGERERAWRACVHGVRLSRPDSGLRATAAPRCTHAPSIHPSSAAAACATCARARGYRPASAALREAMDDVVLLELLELDDNEPRLEVA